MHWGIRPCSHLCSTFVARFCIMNYVSIKINSFVSHVCLSNVDIIDAAMTLDKTNEFLGTKSLPILLYLVSSNTKERLLGFFLLNNQDLLTGGGFLL